MMGELPPRLDKGDHVRVVSVFAQDVEGIVDDDYQSVVPLPGDESDLRPAMRLVELDEETVFSWLPVNPGAMVLLHGLVVLVNESDLFLIEEDDA